MMGKGDDLAFVWEPLGLFSGASFFVKHTIFLKDVVLWDSNRSERLIDYMNVKVKKGGTVVGEKRFHLHEADWERQV